MRACSSSRKVASIASFPRRQESKNVFRNLWKGFLWSLDIGGRLSLSRKHLFLHYGSNLGQNFINGPDKLETTGIFPECRCLLERRRYVSTLVVFSQVLQISKKKKNWWSVEREWLKSLERLRFLTGGLFRLWGQLSNGGGSPRGGWPRPRSTPCRPSKAGTTSARLLESS